MLFIVIGYVGAHKKIIEALDHRSARIKLKPDEARRLRDEAENSSAEYQRKQGEAEREADCHHRRSQGQAQRVAAEARGKAGRSPNVRRTRLAEAKIRQAEAQALADVKAAAADAAVAAAEKILRETAKGKVADDLVAQGIAERQGEKPT